MLHKHILLKVLLMAALLSGMTASQAFAADGWGAPVTVDSAGVVGMYASLAQVNGNPAIAYYDATNGDLKFARANDAEGTTWGAPIVLDSTGVVGPHLSLAIVNGNPAVSYYNGNDLKFTRASNTDGSAWGAPLVVDEADGVGLYTSLAVVNGHPAISYFDLTNGNLNYAYSGDANGETWDSPVVIDETNTVGEYTSLAVVNGRPAISYYDRSNESLKFARASDADGANWSAPITIDSGSVGTYSSLAMVNGNPAVSYHDPNALDDHIKFIRAADANGTTWDAPIILDTGNLGAYTSLEVIGGNPAVSYQGSAGLRFAQASDANGSVWNTPVTLDAVAVSHTSLADINGGPAVAYHASASGDLRYIHLDANPPNVTIDQAATQPDPTYVSPVNFTAVFSEPVFGFDNNDVQIDGMSGTPVVSVVNSGDNMHFNISVSGLLDLDHVTATIPAGGASDTAGNLNLDSTSTDNVVIYTTSQPLVVSIVRLNASPTASSTVGYAVTFTEPVIGVTVDDFVFTNNGVGGTYVAGIGGSSTVYTVTVNTGYGGNGSLRLDVLDDDSIIDVEGNPLGDVGVYNGNFERGQSYQVLRASFVDVPTSFWAWKQIESIYFAQITGGCISSPLTYCPNNNVNREQMSIFLLRSMYGPAYLPPDAGASTGFGDVAPSYWAADWIKQLAAEGITGGCGSGNFCPTIPVSRAQMAVFLLRAKYGSTYLPPDAGASTGFTDVPLDYWAADWIKQLAAEGITGGCGGGNFCPETSVTRAQMAIFLQKTFNLNMP